MYKPADHYKYRPNTKKLYEEHYGVTIPEGYEVHHIVPERLGGSHSVENLTVLHWQDHAAAHLELYEKFGDPRDLCAYHMISGRSYEAHLAACAMGGKASQKAKRERGQANGFQLFDQAKRKAIATKAGAIGGARQKRLGLGIHTNEETRREWARLGAQAVKGQFSASEIQSSRGKRGGVKNAGFKWYSDGERDMKYTAEMQKAESFEDFLNRTGYKKGRKRK